jgi:hypothetical protein
VAVSCIGRIDAAPGLRVLDAAGCEVTGGWTGFDHFSTGADTGAGRGDE